LEPSLEQKVQVAIATTVGAPVVHIQLGEKRKEHDFENAVGFGAHENFTLVQLLGVDVLINRQIGSIFFKQALLPNVEGEHSDNQTCYNEPDKVPESIISLIFGIRENMWETEAATCSF
tara:strand:- start:124 stop:480 length:357 start_codon:yes stop_codon:yes gene_type:complete